MSDQKCIYRFLSGEVCGLPKRDWRHDTTAVSHIFQAPLEITDEAVEAFQESVVNLLGDHEVKAGLEAALRVMQKGQDK